MTNKTPVCATTEHARGGQRKVVQKARDIYEELDCDPLEKVIKVAEKIMEIAFRTDDTKDMYYAGRLFLAAAEFAHPKLKATAGVSMTMAEMRELMPTLAPSNANPEELVYVAPITKSYDKSRQNGTERTGATSERTFNKDIHKQLSS